MDDKVTVMGDWTPNPSPRTFLSNFLNEDFGSRSFSDLLAENGDEAPASGSDGNKEYETSKEEGDAGNQFSGDLTFALGSFNTQKSSQRGGLTERIAMRAGFNAPKLNTAHIRSANMDSSSSEIRSPYLTIPPGLSPTALLDSPAFLSNTMAQPSPTTGRFLFGQGNSNNPIPISEDSNGHQLQDFDFASEAFAFKPPLDSSSSFFSSAESQVEAAIDNQRQFPSMKVSAQSENCPVSSQNQQELNFRNGFSDSSGRKDTADDAMLNQRVSSQNQQEFNFRTGFSDSSGRKDTADDAMLNQRVSDSFTGNEHSPPLDDHPDGEGDTKEPSSVAAPAEDGYNWRKYGQKQVKGSEYPRSYYKCTHPNCQVKKKVERSHEGHINEIIYKGAHNHPKPPPNRRSAVGPHLFNEAQFDGSEQAGFETKPFLASAQNGIGGHDWKNDGLETSSASAAEFCDPSVPMQAQDGSRLDTPDAIDVSSTLSNDEEDDQATHGSVSLGGEGEGDETESKRRKLEACTVEMGAASRAVREPRVVVQTTSEVDILDDGYRWRKYGQKVVKGNPNPRSYYKCTHQGCTVRKHVERASHDLKSVITTYEGKHIHEVPAARNSGSHASSLSSSTTGPSATAQAHTFNRRLELAQDSIMRFDGRASLGSLGLQGREMLGQVPSFSFAMQQQRLADLGMAGLGSMAQMKMPVLPPVNSFMGHRQSTEAGFMIPKGEPKEEPMQDSGLNMSSGASSVYRQMMGRLPLEPQL